MSDMTDSDSPVKPQSEVLFLLGGLNAKMDAVLATQTAYDNRLLAVERTLATVQAQQPPRAPWWSIAAGIGSLIAIVAAIVAVTLYVAQ